MRHARSSRTTRTPQSIWRGGATVRLACSWNLRRRPRCGDRGDVSSARAAARRCATCDGSFYDFRRASASTARSATLPARTAGCWGGRAAIAWARQLAARHRLRSRDRASAMDVAPCWMRSMAADEHATAPPRPDDRRHGGRRLDVRARARRGRSAPRGSRGRARDDGRAAERRAARGRPRAAATSVCTRAPTGSSGWTIRGATWSARANGCSISRHALRPTSCT